MIRNGRHLTRKLQILVTHAFGQMSVAQMIRVLFFRPKTRSTLIRLTAALLSVALVLILLSKRQESVEERNRQLLQESSFNQHDRNPNPNHRHHRHGLRSAAPAISLSAKDEQLFRELNPANSSWGTMGRPVDLSSPEEKRKAEQLFKLGAFNVYISDRIEPNRSLPEARPSECAAKYDDLSDSQSLPTASVIVIFTDEIWSALIRTLWSVWNRSPDHLLKEIILVDDFSKREELKHTLEVYCKYYFGDRVKILRTASREGLIRARIMGAKVAAGDVLIFLDSHCECTTGWLEPLLDTIRSDPKTVVCPVIDVISDKTMEYSVGDRYYFQVGGFTWSGHFTWIDVQEDFTKRHPTTAVESPTMAGGLFAMDAKYFFELGSYDEAMEIWGGENLELSFRTWMCGGRLVIHPCSHVGHIFRDYHPYSFQGKDTHGINTLRTILVWMDPEYHRYFFMYRNDLKGKKAGDLRSRFKLKQKLKCKSFRWYLDNIFKGNKFIYDQKVLAFGTVMNAASNLCLDILNRDEEKSQLLGLYTCAARDESSYTNQVFSLTRIGEVRREETCAGVTDDSENTVEMGKCVETDKADQERLRVTLRNKKKQTWTHERHGLIKNKFDQQCLSAKGLASGQNVLMRPCDASDHYQKWSIQTYL